VPVDVIQTSIAPNRAVVCGSSRVHPG
jgi:hypothetical protein